jgi:hypothetical protein
MAPSAAKAAGHKHNFEFFGPHGPAVLVLVLPAVCFALILGCNMHSCLQLWPELKLPSLQVNMQWYTQEALLGFLVWFFGVALLHVVLPGQRAEGVLLPDGKRLVYKLNGKQSTHHIRIISMQREARLAKLRHRAEPRCAPLFHCQALVCPMCCDFHCSSS